MFFLEDFLKIFNLYFFFSDIQKFVFFLQNRFNPLMQGGYKGHAYLNKPF